jgi:MFS family permease
MLAAGGSRLPWALAWRLSAGQIVSWGILYYAFTVVAGPIHVETGWSRAFINAGLSVGLLAWGIAAFPVGAWIQRRGARAVMAAATVIGSGALALMSAATTGLTYFAAWVLLGVAMAGALYEPAFAAITRAFGAEYRKGITLVTLVAGFASTVFVPIAQMMVDRFGWRDALLMLAAFQVAVAFPINFRAIPPLEPAPPPPARPHAGFRSWLSELQRDLGDRRFLGLAVWFSGHAAAATGLIFLIVPLLQSRAVPTAHILQAIAIVGPMQVLGRVVLTRYGGNFSAIDVGKWAMAAIAAATLILLLLPWNPFWLGTFAALFGFGNGILTIVRGTAVAEFFGTARYAELNGALSAPAVLTKAAAPLALGALWSATQSSGSVVGLIAVFVAVSIAGLLFAQRSRARSEASSTGEVLA